MKRFAFWFVLGLVAISVIKAKRESRVQPPPPEHRVGRATILLHKSQDPEFDKRGAILYRVEGDGRRPATLQKLAKRFPDANFVLIDNSEDDGDQSERRQKVKVGELPVPVIEGTVVTEANTEPIAPQPPIAPQAPIAPQPPTEAVVTTVDELGELKDVKVKPVTSVTGRISATEARAKADARVQLIGLIRSRLEGEIPQGWDIPGDLIDSLIQKTDVKTSQREFGTYYEATFALDPNPEAFQKIAAAYQHEQVVKRLTLMGGALGFVLLCLGTLTGYIKADEATKGYYTNRLRLASAVGVGAGGVLLYQMVINKV